MFVSELGKLCVQTRGVLSVCEPLKPCPILPATAPWQGTREQMPLHWGASGHQIGNITVDVPIQLQATN